MSSSPSSILHPPFSPPVRKSVIDVGTNSVKLLVADVRGGEILPVLEQSEQTRLGRGFYQTRRLQPDAIAHTAQAVADFATRARELHSPPPRVIATSAARDALNASELADAVQRAAGLPLEVITGDQEAVFAFRGVSSDPALAGRPLLILDVGGGSTEFILGEGDEPKFCRSFPIGSVRLLEELPPSDPPAHGELAACRRRVKEFLDGEVRETLTPALEVMRRRAGDVLLVGTGGTTTILARMEHRMSDFDRARIEATRLTRARVAEQRERLWSLPLAQRRELSGLPPKRADVILFGAVIYEAVMENFNFGEVRVSTRGLRFGAVLSERK